MEDIEMTFEEWVKEFEPVSDTESDDYPRDVPVEYLWSKMNMDGMNWITDGVHIVNAIGYFETKKPYDRNCSYLVDLPDDEPVNWDEV